MIILLFYKTCIVFCYSLVLPSGDGYAALTNIRADDLSPVSIKTVVAYGATLTIKSAAAFFSG